MNREKVTKNKEFEDKIIIQVLVPIISSIISGFFLEKIKELIFDNPAISCVLFIGCFILLIFGMTWILKTKCSPVIVISTFAISLIYVCMVYYNYNKSIVAYAVRGQEEMVGNTAYTYLREAPSVHSDIVLALRRQNIVYLRKNKIQEADGIEWGYGSFCDCKGWINMSYLSEIMFPQMLSEKEKDYYVSVDTVKVRSAPNRNSSKVAGTLKYGTSVKVESFESGWGKIAPDSYILMTCLNRFPAGKYYVNTPTGDKIHLRRKRDELSESKTLIQNGESVIVEKVVEGWGYVKYGEYDGWVKMGYLTMV